MISNFFEAISEAFQKLMRPFTLTKLTLFYHFNFSASRRQISSDN